MGENEISYKIIGVAIEIHKKYGSGLLENAYEKILAYELRLLGIDIKEQLNLPLIHKDLKIENAYRIDLLVDDCRSKSSSGNTPNLFRTSSNLFKIG